MNEGQRRHAEREAYQHKYTRKSRCPHYFGDHLSCCLAEGHLGAHKYVENKFVEEIQTDRELEGMAEKRETTEAGPISEGPPTLDKAVVESEGPKHNACETPGEPGTVDAKAWSGNDSANALQVGGSHYKIGGEEHWDRQYRLNGPGYHVGCATKYAERHMEKGGVDDLLKGIHYLYKLVELELADPIVHPSLKVLTPSAKRILEQLRKAGSP